MWRLGNLAQVSFSRDLYEKRPNQIWHKRDRFFPDRLPWSRNWKVRI